MNTKPAEFVERRKSPWREIVDALDSRIEAAESQGHESEVPPATPRKLR